MYVAGGEHAHKEQSRRFLTKVQRGEFEGCTSVEVLQEILYRYCSLGKRELAREVYDLFVQISDYYGGRGWISRKTPIVAKPRHPT